MVKSFIKVFIRVRPTSQPTDRLSLGTDGATVNVELEMPAGTGGMKKDVHSFKFDGYLENATQETIYSDCAAEVVDSVLTGYNGTIFCYGQTGAGKTFSMAGDPRSYQQRGIIPRVVHQIFREIDLRVDRMYKVWVTYLEVYNEMMYDLLSDSPGSAELHVIDENNSVKVRGLNMAQVRSEEEALGMFFMGEGGRSTAQHILNSNSSRSHCVFTVHLEMRGSSDASERAIKSKINMVDLAGSERTKKTGVTGQTLKEATFINKSLSFLEQTVNALSKKASHVPFRQSKLTSVLRDALGGNCKTVMLANIWGESAHLEETVSTLRFASRVKLIQTDAQVNESQDLALQVERYKRQIKELKQELMMRDALSGRGRVSYDDLNEAEQMELMALCKSFLDGAKEVDDLPQDTMKNVREAFKQMRNVYQSMKSNMSAQVNQELQRRLSANAADHTAGLDGGNLGMVGDEEKMDGTGFAVGLAPSGAKPEADTTEAAEQADPNDPMASPAKSEKASPIRNPSVHSLAASHAAGGDAEKNAAFMRYKREDTEGRSLAEAVASRQKELADTRAKIKDLGAKVNAAKKTIDDFNLQVQQKRAGTTAGGTAKGEPLDAEEFDILGKLKQAKLSYRAEFDQLKDLKAKLELYVAQVADARESLVEAFQVWYEDNGPTEDAEEFEHGENFDHAQRENWHATEPEAAAYLTAKKGMKTTRNVAYGGDKGRAQNIRRRDALR